MVEKIINIILANTFTTDELSLRLGLLRRYFSVLLFEKVMTPSTPPSIHSVLKDEGDEQTLTALEAWLQAFTEHALLAQAVYQSLDAVEQEIAAVPTATLYLPTYFTPEHVAGFALWFRREVQPNIILSVRTDPHVGGGCGIVWNNVYHDISIRYFIQQHRDAIVTLFDRLMHQNNNHANT